ncbi:MAG: HU family DNA-binding protein [Bulleidia sp.]
MNKKMLADAVAESQNITKKQAVVLVDCVFTTIAEALKEGTKVDITGFGKFEVKTRAPRTGINPQTKESIEIPATKVPGFKASKSLKDLVR